VTEMDLTEKQREMIDEIVRWAERGLLGAGALDEDGVDFTCHYKRVEKRCAVGCLLTDEELSLLRSTPRVFPPNLSSGNYNEGASAAAAIDLLGVDPLERWGFSAEDMNLIQEAHDGIASSAPVGEVDPALLRATILDRLRGSLR